MLPLPGRLTHLHQAPGVRLSRCLVRTNPSKTLSLTGPSSAPGLVSNAFRRNAAHKLWSACYPCSIFHALASRFLAVPPPLSALPTPGSSCHLRLHILRLSDGAPSAVFQSALCVSLVCSQPRVLLRRLSPSRGPLVPLLACHPTREPPASTCHRLSARNLSRASLHPHGSDHGYGPCHST